MSIFRFSAEFRFFFLLSAFLKIIFRFFLKSRRQKKKEKKSQSPTPPLSGEFKGRVQRACHRRESSQSSGTRELRYAGARFFGFWSKFESAVSPLGTRNLTPATVRRLDEGRRGWWLEGRRGWWLGGGMVEGLEMIVTEPVSVL